MVMVTSKEDESDFHPGDPHGLFLGTTSSRSSTGMCSHPVGTKAGTMGKRS